MMTIKLYSEAGDCWTTSAAGDGTMEIRPGDPVAVCPENPRKSKHRGRTGQYVKVVYRCDSCGHAVEQRHAECKRCRNDHNNFWTAGAVVKFSDTGRNGVVEMADLRKPE